MGVRFIAVNDGYDSLDPAASDSLSMHLKNLVNDVYARDISRKICPVLQKKQERGEFIGNWVYGYLKSEEDTHRLVPDKETASVVQQMFQRRLSGMNYQSIARELNGCGIPAPGRYRFEKGIVKNRCFAGSIWTGETVREILASKMYLGHMVQGKRRKALWNGQDQTGQPKEHWIIVKNTHEALIDQKTFDAVQEMAQRDRRGYHDKQGAFPEIRDTENILKGLVYCGDCGKRLVRQKHVQKRRVKNPGIHIRYYFYCHTHVTDRSRCVSVRVPEDDLLETVTQVIRSHLAAALDIEALIKSAQYRSAALSKKQEIRCRIKQAEEQLRRLARLRETLYDDYLGQLMNERDYLYARDRYAQQESEQRRLLEELAAQDAAVRDTGTQEPAWLRTLLSFRENPELSRKLALELIDRIIVYNKADIAVRLRFEDEYKSLMEQLLPQEEVAANG